MRTWALVRTQLDVVSDVYLAIVGARHRALVSMLALRVVLALVLWATPTYAWSGAGTVVSAADVRVTGVVSSVPVPYPLTGNTAMIGLALPLVLAMGVALVGLEHVFPAHPIRPDVRWYVRAAAINALQVLVYVGVDRAQSQWVLPSLNLVGHRLPAFAGALVAYVIFTFVVYWWHRVRHASPLIWRIFHQFHHSPTRIQTLTAYYIHPLDMIVVLTISNLILFPLLGLDLEAAAWYTVITGFAGFFIHANIPVPRAVGYVFQTPEMHRLHHKSGHHADNYADIVWWDMLFGTYANPRERIDACGFDEDSEREIVPMLAGIDLFRSR